MPTPDELVQGAIAFFFDTVLPQPPIGRTFDQLPDPSVHIGSYTAWDNTPVTTSVGQSITPAYALRVSPALPVANGRPNPAGVTPPTSGPARHLLWVRSVADAAVDDAAEIARVMADLDSFANLFSSGTPAGSAQPGAGGSATDVEQAAARATEWAAAIVAARPALGGDLTALTAVPPALDPLVPDLAALKEVLQHFFTYTADGAHYSRWVGAGRDPANPAHLTPEYKQHNVLEQALARDEVYLYAVLPEALLAGTGDLGGGVFREIVVRFQPTGLPDRPFTLATLHTVRIRPPAGEFCDLVFFYAADGRGIPVPRPALNRMSTSLVSLVGHLLGNEPNNAVLADSDATATAGDGQPHLVHLIATVSGEPTLPAGVISSGDGAVRVLLAPPDQIAVVAALPEVVHLGLVAASELHNDQARAMVGYPALDAKLPAGKKGGRGVLVGIIDSGIDASHPAFAGRLHSVWDQGDPVVFAAPNPAAAHPGNHAYDGMNFGAELTGLAVANAGDPNDPADPDPPDGHGTHTAGTVAGAEVAVGGAVVVPAGLAPQATIAVVRGIAVSNSNPALAVKWIFNKATELGMPCVINMSFGSHNNAHDGSDPQSRSMLDSCLNAGAYRPGRVLVASAGNERRFNMHVRRSVPANNPRFVLGTVQIPATRTRQRVIIWAKDPTGTKPAAFPLSVYVYRRTGRRNTFKDITQAVTLGTQASTASTPPTTAAGTFPNHRTMVEIITGLSNPINGDHSFEITFSRTVPALPMLENQWRILLVNGSPQPLDVHAWALDGSTFMEALEDDDHAYLVGRPASSAATISVASCNSRLSWTNSVGTVVPARRDVKLRDVSSFSSPGPMRASSVPPASFPPAVAHEVNAVDVTAPGAFLQSALSSQVGTAAWILANPDVVINNQSQVMSGTSMAAPVITGLVANILADEPLLTMPQVLARLKAASSIPADSEYQPPAGAGPNPLSVDWGYGLVDAGKLKP